LGSRWSLNGRRAFRAGLWRARDHTKSRRLHHCEAAGETATESRLRYSYDLAADMVPSAAKPITLMAAVEHSL
jgi:hypothetical protein